MAFRHASCAAEVSPGRVSPLFHRAGRLRSRPDGRLPSALATPSVGATYD